MNQTGLLLVVTGLILPRPEHSVSSAKRRLGYDAGCKHFTEPFGNRTDHALSAHADRPQSRGTFCHPAAFISHKKHPVRWPDRVFRLRHMLVPINLFVFHAVRFFARYRADGLLLRHKSFRYIRRSFRALIERCR